MNTLFVAILLLWSVKYPVSLLISYKLTLGFRMMAKPINTTMGLVLLVIYFRNTFNILWHLSLVLHLSSPILLIAQFIILFFFIVVAQSYEVEADNEYVIRGNSAVMKCEVPSFVSDFVYVEMWQDSQGNTFLPGVNDGKIIKRNFLTSNWELLY